MRIPKYFVHFQRYIVCLFFVNTYNGWQIVNKEFLNLWLFKLFFKMFNSKIRSQNIAVAFWITLYNMWIFMLILICTYSTGRNFCLMSKNLVLDKISIQYRNMFILIFNLIIVIDRIVISALDLLKLKPEIIYQ